MSDLVFASASLADAEAIAEAEKEIFSDAWSMASVSDFLRSPLSRSVTVKDPDGNLVAYCLLQWIAPEGEILRIATLPAYRRKGIGFSLLEYAVQNLDSAGQTALYLEVRSQNAPAVALYRSFGFEIISLRKKYYQFPADDALFMRRIGR